MTGNMALNASNVQNEQMVILAILDVSPLVQKRYPEPR